jgi:hypothetical protein
MFEDCKPLIAQDRKSISGQERKPGSDQERKWFAGPIEEEESPRRESREETSRSIERGPPRHRHRPAALRDWPAEDVDAVRRALAGFRYKDGSPVQPTDALVTRLLDIAKFYMRTAFEIPALLHRKENELQKKPRWWPEKDDWFVHVVDRAYAEDWMAQRIPPARAETPAAPAPIDYPEDPGTQAEFAALVKQLATAKGFPRR